MRTWLIIGSTATYHWFPDARPPKDLDLLTQAEITVRGVRSCFVDAQWHAAAELVLTTNQDAVFADPDVLYTLKASHAHWPIKWDKTMHDLEFLRRKGCRLIEALYHPLVAVWRDVHGRSRVNLNQPVEAFFNDAVARRYDHERLHELVAFNGRPMHERIRPDLTRAWCSEALFNALTPDEQAQTALEEIIVTAIERSRLEQGARQSEKHVAMAAAHRRLCTSMTTGWFSRFLILNRHDLLSTRRPQWLPTMNTALSRLSTEPQRASS